MKEESLSNTQERYAFMRNDNQRILCFGSDPEDAWANLCESLEDDILYIRKFFDVNVNKEAVKHGFQWLNNVIGNCEDKETGPVFIRCDKHTL